MIFLLTATCLQAAPSLMLLIEAVMCESTNRAGHCLSS
jgi:hypothetical protein